MKLKIVVIFFYLSKVYINFKNEVRITSKDKMLKPEIKDAEVQKTCPKTLHQKSGTQNS